MVLREKIRLRSILIELVFVQSPFRIEKQEIEEDEVKAALDLS